MANGTWCPFNRQNTALHRDLIPAYVPSPLHEKERVIGLEAGGILCKILRCIDLTNHAYFSCAVELVDKLEAAVAASEELKPNAGAVKWVNDMISTYRAWFTTMQRPLSL